MEGLPPELMDLIFLECDHSTLKSLRLVCSQYRDATTPRVFEHFYGGMFQSSLDRLCMLSKSSLAKHVKWLTFYADILPDWDRAEWEQSIDFRPDIKSWSNIRDFGLQVSSQGWSSELRRYDEYDKVSRHGFSQEELDQGWHQFKKLLNEQQKWREDIHSLSFREHFAMLPNLVEAKGTTATPFQGKTSGWPVWKRLRQQVLVSPDDWMYKTDYWDGTKRAELSGQASLCLVEGIGYRASFAGTKHVQKLTVHASHNGPYEKLIGSTLGRGNEPPTPEYRARYQTILEGSRHLTELDLRMPHAAESDEDGGEDTGEEVLELLHSAKQLKRLNLAYNDDEAGFGFAPLPAEPSLAPLFKAEPPWQQLEHLSLTVDMPHWLLLPFFQRVAPTLHSLEMKDMLVKNVKELFTQIPKILKLQHVYIECIWHESMSGDGSDPENFHCVLERGSDVDEPYERAIKAYLLRKTSELPELQLGPAQRFQSNIEDDELDEDDGELDDDQDDDEE